MKRPWMLLMALVLMAGDLPSFAWAQPQLLPAGAYALDPARARLTATMAFLKIGQFRTRYQRLSGGFTYDPQQPDAGGLTIQVDPRSMDNAATPFGKRMLVTFETDRYPTITFVARRLVLKEGPQALAGELTLHGVTRPVTLAVTLTDVTGVDHATFTGTCRIRRSDFGITSMRGVVADRVDLAFEVEFVRR